jgi:hypothetical protein
MLYFPPSYYAPGYWSALYWATSAMVPDSYPDLPLDNESIREPLARSDADLLADGTPIVRTYATVDGYRFKLVHSYITYAQALSVEAVWAANRNDTIVLTWAMDGLDYDVYFDGAPQIGRHEGGKWWAKAEVVGVAQ